MSKQKRALVVDDSRSARLVLRRMLEKYDLAVDTVESARLALDFLTRNRPDVIFMDHMMPGMDGFEAVKAIKNNPDTATIPVMMYTSKGGDLYLGQARALGAVGVLPKTVAPAELFSSLQKIGLIKNRRKKNRKPEEESASERAEDIQAAPASVYTVPRFSEPGMHKPSEPLNGIELDTRFRRLLEEQSVEFRKDVLLSMETVTRQTGNRFKKELDEKLAVLQQRAPGPERHPLAMVILTALLVVSLIMNIYMLNGDETHPAAVTAGDNVLTSDSQPVVEAISRLEALYAERADQLKQAWMATGWALNQELGYAYDELALDNQRADLVEQLLEYLSATGYTGKIILETHAGKFCLLGDQQTGFRLPPPELTVDQCEFTGNPVQPADSAAAHQSLEFANFINSSPLLGEDSIMMEVVAISRDDPVYDYPDKSDQTTAQSWNRAAARNNRVVIHLEPR